MDSTDLEPSPVPGPVSTLQYVPFTRTFSVKQSRSLPACIEIQIEIWLENERETVTWADEGGPKFWPGNNPINLSAIDYTYRAIEKQFYLPKSHLVPTFLVLPMDWEFFTQFIVNRIPMSIFGQWASPISGFFLLTTISLSFCCQ